MTAAHLSGLRVLELSRLLPGPFCSMILADLGAEVIKLESPLIGDPMRIVPPLAGGQSAYFLSINRNKKSVALNLRRQEGRQVLLRLARNADVLIESYRPGQAEQMGIGYEALRAVNPRLVYCSLSGFGQEGSHRDRPGHDLSYAALAGLLDLMRPADAAPFVPGVPLADMSSALFAAVGILSALLARSRNGEGAFVDTSIYQSAVALATFPASTHLSDKVPNERGQRYLLGSHPGYHLYRTKDGRFMALTALEPVLWADFCESIDRPDLIGNHVPGDEDRGVVIADLERTFAQRTQAEWIRFFADHPVSCEPVRTLDEALASDLARESVLPYIDHPTAGSLTQIGLPWGQHANPGHRHSPAPLLGQHTVEILETLGYRQEDINRLRLKRVVATADDVASRRRRRIP